MSEGVTFSNDDGIVTAVMDMPGQPVNTMNAAFDPILEAMVAQIARDDVKGMIITSGKETFFAGGDLEMLRSITPADQERFFHNIEKLKAGLRALETSGKPVVAAINGAALGGGYEICLACHYRIALNNPKTEIGCPEATLGLLPGGGGVTRMVRMFGMEKALPLLMEGKRLRVQAARESGLIDEIATSPDDMMAKARAWIATNPAPVKPWDQKGYRIPGGDSNHPKMAQMLSVAPAMLVKKTRGLLPAPEVILAVAAEGALVDFDTASRIESRGLTKLATTPEAKNMISTLFFGLNAINAGVSRPKGFERRKFKKMGMLGAGMMGAAIAYVSARAGMDVVLKDVSVEAAEKGKDYSRQLMDKAIARGRASEDDKTALLARIHPTAQADDLKGCEIVIEAVFEDADLKAKVTKEAEAVLGKDAIFASNTSTLPITMLAGASRDASKFIGLHFFSPADKMPLVEIIRGDGTSDETLAASFDFVRQIKKTPMIANDHLGFFTSRVFSTYMDEGMHMLREGIDPVLIENLARQTGMPVGPLTVMDEVSQKLAVTVRAANEKLIGSGIKGSHGLEERGEATAEVLNWLTGEHGRQGKAYNGGFYDYSQGEKRLFEPLRARFNSGSARPSDEDIKDRILFRQVIEAFRCLEEGVINSEIDGNVGSIMGIGFPVHTGGVYQYVDTYGPERFVQRADELANKYGARFNPPQYLRGRAQKAKHAA